MDGFIQKYRQDVTGTLSGWDRLRFRGTLRALAVTGGMRNYLCQIGVLLKDFGAFVERESTRVKQACQEMARRLDRPVRYLPSSRTSKEDLAAGIARADGVTEGLVCLLRVVEPCMSYEIRRDREKHKLLLQPSIRKCLHFFHYWMDRDFGLMHARLQTWFPFSITWRPMRKGVVDLRRRAEVSQGCNRRYYEALTTRQIITAVLRAQDLSFARLAEAAA